MDAPGDPAEKAIDDVEQLVAHDDDTAAGRDMAADNDPSDGEEGDDSGLPPEGDDPMDGAAPTG